MARESGISLYLDEDVAKAIAQGVRRQRYEVVTTQEANRLGTDDAGQLAFAAAGGHAVVTYNQGDFCRLHVEYVRANKQHAGIIVASRKVGLGETLRRILSLLDSVDADDMRNQIKWLSEYR
jgi:hypothetical protein